MKQVPDRKKLRREYVKKKAAAYGVGGPFLVIMLTFLVAWFREPGLDVSQFAVLLFCFVWCAVNFSRETIKHVPYVPTVTPNTLRADEILVRGSEEPLVAQSEVLLRAAQQMQETPKEELLRVSRE